MTEHLRKIVADNRAGTPCAIVSVCTAHPDALRASLNWAERRDIPIVIEATSNQANQDGGYTGMTAADFASALWKMADGLGVDRARVTLGGDHLGPQAWRALPPEAAMEKARVLVESYVEAGFDKIHLDCSQGCAGEPEQLSDHDTATRSADLAARCEAAASGRDILYVIGTEVPPPGGARADEEGDIPATTPDAARRTLAAHAEAFAAAGLDGIEARVAGLVVQPGVEFSPMHVNHLPLDRDPGLRAVSRDWPALCLEAHSTDYQHPAAYHRLAELGFAFQKVGPALTFAYREALYALDWALTLSGRGVGLFKAMESLLQSDPAHWAGHYAPGDQIARHFGYADRIRYYWPRAEARSAVAALLHAVSEHNLPEPLLSQVFSNACLDRAETLSGPFSQRLIDAKIELALDPYDLTQRGAS